MNRLIRHRHKGHRGHRPLWFRGSPLTNQWQRWVRGPIIRFLCSQMQLHQSHTRPPQMLLNVFPDRKKCFISHPIKKKKKIPSVLHIWIKTRKDLQTHAVPLTTLYVLDDKSIILKACVSICECDLHNFILMTYWFSWFSVKCYLSLTCAW